MERKESNRLILDFMGVKPFSTGNIHSWSDAPFYYTTEDTFDKVMDNMSNYAKYDTSWEWIMPVVEKIRSLGFWIEVMAGAQNLFSVGEFNKSEPFIFTGNLLENSSLKIVAYQGIVEFIQWHNNSQIKNI